MAAWPLAFFLAAPYTEGLLFAFAAGSLLAARRGRWLPAAICAALATLTRPTGLALFLPLIWEYGRQQGIFAASARKSGFWRRWLSFRRVAAAATVALAVPFGLAVYMVYLKLKFGHFRMFLEVASFWNRQSRGVYASMNLAVTHFLQTAPYTHWKISEIMDLGSVVLFVLITLVMVRQMPFAFTLYTLGIAYLSVTEPIPGVPDVLPSAGRYMLMAFPVFIILGRWAASRSWLENLLVGGGFLLQGVLVAFFLSGGWVG
jgi:Gpi18-like mannosyltransferase